jgi:tetratricopeptide (TPR) repeat protein
VTSNISLRSRGLGVAFLSTVVLLGALLAGNAVRIAIADFWGDSYDIVTVRRAIALDPNNPEFHQWLGVLYLSGAAPDFDAALPSLRKATELNPRQSRYWLELAQGCFVTGDHACADRSFERAIQLEPMRPGTAWDAANYYVATDQPDLAFAHFRRLLDLSPDQAEQAFELSWRGFNDPARIWQDLVSQSRNVQVKCAYLTFLAEKNRFDLTGKYWTEIAHEDSAPTFVMVQSYLQRLLGAQQYTEAAQLWQDILRLGVVSRPKFQSPDNLVFNASFEQPILNAGFDWQTPRQDYVSVDFSDPASRGQGNALRVDFTVPHNADVEPLYQFVPVVPNQSYQLSAYVRSEEITSESGPRLRIQDAVCPACLDTATEGTVGTTPTHHVTMTFATGPQTSVVRLSLWRPRGRTFPMDIQGHFWLEEVSLITLKPVAVDGRVQ